MEVRLNSLKNIDNSAKESLLIAEIFKIEDSMTVKINSLFAIYKLRDISKLKEKKGAAMRKVFGGDALNKKK